MLDDWAERSQNGPDMIKQLALSSHLLLTQMGGSPYQDSVTEFAVSMFYSEHCERGATKTPVFRKAMQWVQNNVKDGEQWLRDGTTKLHRLEADGDPVHMCAFLFRKFGPDGTILPGMIKRTR